MSIRKKYWDEVKKSILRKDCRLAAEMIMAVMTSNVKSASELYRKAINS